MTKLSEFPSLVTKDRADVRHQLDVDDLTDGPGGSNKAHTFAEEQDQGDLWRYPLTVAALATLGAAHTDGDIVTVKAYTALDDKGGGNFWLDKSGALGSSAENTGTIFATDGGVDQYWRRFLDAQQTLTPYMFGAPDDGATDAAVEIQAAAAAAEVLSSGDNKPVLYFPSGPGFLTNDTIFIKENIIVRMDSFLICDVDQNEKGMVVGTADINNSEISGSSFRIKRLDFSSWADEGSIGLQLINLIESSIFVAIGGAAGDGFTIGCQIIGHATGPTSDRGSAWNLISFGRMVNNKIAVQMTNQSDGVAKGFVTENKLFGGRIGRGSGVNIGKANFGWVLTSNDGKSKNTNNNQWISPSFELNEAVSSPAESLPVLIEHGNENEVRRARNESNGPVFARILPDFQLATPPETHNRNNTFTWTHTNATIDDQCKQASSRYWWYQRQLSEGHKEIFDSGPLHEVAVRYDGSTTHLADVHFTTSSSVFSRNANAVFFIDEAGATIDDGNDEIDITAHNVQLNDNVFWSGASLPAHPAHPNSTDKYFAVNIQTDTFQLSLTRNGSAVTLSAGSGTYHKRHNWVELPAAGSFSIGRFIDTRVAKEFLITHDTELGFPGRMRIMAFDSAGLQLQNNDTFTVAEATDEIIPDAGSHNFIVDDPITFTTTGTLPGALQLLTVYFVKAITATRFTISETQGGDVFNITAAAGSGVQTVNMEHFFIKGNNMAFSGAYGGNYFNGSDVEEDWHIVCRDEVESVNFLVSGGTAACRIRRFQVYSRTVDSDISTWMDYEQGGRGRSLVEAKPTTGVYLGPGRIAWSDTPVGSAQLGFALSQEGTTIVGTHTGGAAEAVLTDSTKDWPVNGLVGLFLTNTTNSETTVVTANTDTTITGVLSGGETWDNGDTYTLETWLTMPVYQ